MNESTSNKSKIEFVARIVNPDGKVVEKTITSSSELPSLDDFDLETREGFLNDMDKLEKSILKARNQIGEAIAEKYLDSAFKKILRKQVNYY